MNVRLGWSGDIHGTWTKMDVELDDSDLILHFADAGVADLSSLEFSPIEKFKLMYVLAEVFVQLHKMSRFPNIFNTDKDRAELADLLRQRDKITKCVLDRNVQGD